VVAVDHDDDVMLEWRVVVDVVVVDIVFDAREDVGVIVGIVKTTGSVEMVDVVFCVENPSDEVEVVVEEVVGSDFGGKMDGTVDVMVID